MPLKGFVVFIAGLFALLVLAGCSGTTSLPEPEPTLQVPVRGAEVETGSVPPPAGPTIEAAETAESTSLQEATATPEDPVIEEQAPPPVREGLEATDPASVQLASGEVQLVEFFAFW